MSRRVSGWCLFLGVMILFGWFAGANDGRADPGARDESIGMAVEFMDHAAAAFVCRDKGWFEAAGLKVESYEAYATGMALASALARGDIEAAFICLVPAINAYHNAGVPIKIVAGTHKHGYGIVARKEAVSRLSDLQNPDLRIGCVREGGAVDVLLRKAIDIHDLDKDRILSHVQRMSPAKQLLSIKTGQLDAAVLPEQWASMAESSEFRMLLTSQEVWPEMQGSVLVVKEKLIKERPETVRKLIKVLQEATDWINQNPRQAAEIVAKELQTVEGGLLKGVGADNRFSIAPDMLQRSMARLDYTTAIDPAKVQEIIDYMARLGYIKSGFAAADILDLRFLEGEPDQ